MTAPSSRMRIVLAAVSLLVLGAVIGVSADRLLHGRGIVIHGSSIDAHEALDALDRAVSLRPEQRERIDSILTSRQVQIDSAWHQARSHVERTINAVIAEIETVLDPDQVAPFRALVDRIHGGGGLH